MAAVHCVLCALQHGLDAVERGGSKALAEVAKLADVRDAPTRAAVTQCLLTAYKVGGDDAWKHIGRGLHSSTFRLNVSAFSGIGGASRGC